MATIEPSSSSPYLYTLSLDCPIPWPANPSYPVRARDAVMAALDSDKGRGRAANGAAASTHASSVLKSAAASNNSSRTAGLLGAPVSEQELQRVDELIADGQPEPEQEAEAEDDEKEEMAEDAPWPESLHALYLECLYAPPALQRTALGRNRRHTRANQRHRQGRSAPPFAAVSRLVRALQLGVYAHLSRTSVEDGECTRDVNPEAAIEPLRALLVPLNKLDVKWHTDVPALVGAWQQEQEQGGQDNERQRAAKEAPPSEPGPTEGPKEKHSATVGEVGKGMEMELVQVDAEADALQSASVSQQAQSPLSRDETAALHRAYTSWRQGDVLEAGPGPHEARDGPRTAGETTQHEGGASDSESRGRSVRLGQRDWLTSLEVTELELQIVLVLHVLSLLPTPARHGRKPSHPAASWFSSVRSAASSAHAHVNGSANGNSTPRKRKMAHPPTLSSTHLSTPRQSRNAEAQGIDTAAQAEDAQKRRSRLDKAYKVTAVRLDELTDSLAIHQAVGGIGDSLADLMGDLLPSREGPASAEGRNVAGAVQELDKYQRFWLDVVEANYADLLPADMLSGCHSKLFTSTSLDLSLHPHAHRRHGPLNPFSAAAAGYASNAAGESERPSPFHHPTPDLRQLARSIQVAQEERERTRIPASPTLAKLVAAQREREQRERKVREEEARMLQGILEDEPDLASGVEGLGPGAAYADASGEADSSRDDTSWLMPPPESAAVADRSRQLRQPATVKGTLQAGGGGGPSGTSQRGLSRSKSSGSFANGSHSLFAARQVEFGAKPKPASHSGDAPTRVKKSSGFSSMALIAGSKGANKPAAPASASASTSDVAPGLRAQAAAETTEGMDRLSKRKLASPRKSGSLGKNRDRTLVLGTPGRERVKIKSSRRAKQSSVFSPFARSASLPSFAASSSAPLMDPGLRAGSGAAGGRGATGGARQVEQEEEDDDWDEMDLLRSSSNTNENVLVGETPQKGGRG